MSKLRMGWSEVSITPQKRASLVGQFAERISEYVEKPITATAFALCTEEDQMILVSCDLVDISENLTVAVREKFKNNCLGIVPEKIVLNAIHTHTGPVYPRVKASVSGTATKDLLEKYLPGDRRYVNNRKVTTGSHIITPEETFTMLVNNISEAVLSAWEGKEEGSFTNAFGRAPVGMCRRVTYTDGSAQMWGETNREDFFALEGGSDTGIELLYTFDKEQKLSGIIINLACPAQCVQHRHFISPDFWGEVRVLLRERFGENIKILAQCSAAGDQCPIDLVRWVEPESDINDPNITREFPVTRKADPSMFDLKGMKLTGRRIAREIISVYDDGLDAPTGDTEFIHKAFCFPLPVRTVTEKEAEEAEKAVTGYIQNTTGNLDYNDVAKLQVHLGILQRFEFQKTMDTYNAEVHIIRLGNIAFASNPFELFLDFGNRIKARSKAHQTFLISIACACEGYVPTEKAEKGGHYSAFVSSGIVGHNGGNRLVEETLKEINKLF